ncbi:MAG: M48 family metalloprotease [Terriglobales bacterium]
MKFRAYTLVAALFVATLAPYTLAQSTDPQNPNPTAAPPVTGTHQTADPQNPNPTGAPPVTGTPQSTDTKPGPDSPKLAPTDTVPQVANPPKESHDGGKNDIDSIGNRKIGNGKGLGNWYSLEKEIAMGKEYAAQVEASVKLVQDPMVTEYVNRIGQNLVRNSDARVPFTIKVVDSDEINAFALPGGFFYVNSGLILAADDEAELAGVMAHEIAHVAARHATRQMTRSQFANLASIPLIFVGGGLGYAIRSAAGIGLPLTFLTFSRGFEAEADYLGLEYMYKSGYDPQAFISFFEKIQAKEKKKPGSLAKAFSTHPQTPDRITKSQTEIAKVLPARDQYIINTSEFDDVKTRLAGIENRRKMTGPDDNKDRPTLRRTTADNSKKTGDGKDSSNDDDRPTLKRRDND